MLDAADRPNDAFAFTIFPYDATLEEIKGEIRQSTSRHKEE